MFRGQVEKAGVSFFMNWTITIDPLRGVWGYLAHPDDLFPVVEPHSLLFLG